MYVFIYLLIYLFKKKLIHMLTYMHTYIQLHLGVPVYQRRFTALAILETASMSVKDLGTSQG